MFVRGPGPMPSGSEHHFNYAQKVFQVGQEGTLGMTMWGLGNLGEISYRRLIAEFAGTLVSQPPPSMAELAERWNAFFWKAYSAELAAILQRVQDLLTRETRTP